MWTSRYQQWNFWAKHERKKMLIQSQQNGKKIARALNSHLPAVWREKPHSCSQGRSDIQDYWQICIAAPSLPVPDQAIQYRHIHPHAQLQRALNGDLVRELLLGWRNKLRLMLPKPIAIKKNKNNRGTYCHPKDLVPALAGKWTLHHITIRKYLFIVITSIAKQADFWDLQIFL